jgi:hypothetical protein
MKAIIGTVTAVDGRGKAFTVSVTTKRGNRTTAKEFTISSSRGATFIRRGQRKAGSSLAKMRAGMTVIVQVEDTVKLTGARLPAVEVWHSPIRPSSGTKGIPLTRRECGNLGGKLENDQNCPHTTPVGGPPGGRVRCRTAAGSMCVDENDKAG